MIDSRHKRVEKKLIRVNPIPFKRLIASAIKLPPRQGVLREGSDCRLLKRFTNNSNDSLKAFSVSLDNRNLKSIKHFTDRNHCSLEKQFKAHKYHRTMMSTIVFYCPSHEGIVTNPDCTQQRSVGSSWTLFIVTKSILS